MEDGRAKRGTERAPTAPLTKATPGEGEQQTEAQPSPTSLSGDEQPSPAPRSDEQPPRQRSAGSAASETRARRRRGCLIFGAGLLTGLLGVPLLLWLVLVSLGGGEPLRPTPPPPGQPDLVVEVSRNYMEQSAQRSANRRAGSIKVISPTIELAPHAEGGVRMVVRSQLTIPILGTHGMVATVRLAAVEGQLKVATERIALGQDGTLPLPGQTLVKSWLNDVVNESVQQRLESNAKYRVEVVDVTAEAESLTVDAFLRER